MARPRKSAAQHKAEGTYRKDRHGEPPEAAALVPVKSVAAPAWLGKDLAPVWRTITADLCAMGALVPSDLPFLEQAFRLYSNALRLQDDLENALGGDPKDISRISAAVVSQSSAAISIFARFGLTPSDRARLLQSLPRQKPKGPGLDDLLR